MQVIRILLDECVDWRLSRELTGYTVKTVPQMGWSGFKNGDLLRQAQERFDVFVTTDQNLSFQQNVPNLKMAVFVLHARSNRIQELVPLVPEILKALSNFKTGTTTFIGN